MRTTPPLRRTLIAVAAAGLLILSGCGTTGGDLADDSTTPGGDGPAVTDGPTGPDDPTGSEDPDDPPARQVTVADLEALLPAEGDFGPDFVLRADSGDEQDEPDDIAFEQAVRAACPEVVEFMTEEEDDANKVERAFEDAQDRTIEVSYNLDPKNLDPATLDTIIEGINGCGEIDITLTSGLQLGVTFEAEPYHDHGDTGVTYFNHIVMNHPSLDSPVRMTQIGIAFAIDGISGSISVGDGLEQVSPTRAVAVEAPDEHLETYPAEIEARLRSLSE